MTQLTTVSELPEGFLECDDPTQLYNVLDGPTLIHLPGEKPEPLFISALLHGNETAGVLSLQQVLRRIQGKSLPRALSLFIGNVAAARFGRRRLQGQPDYNRIWSWGEDAEHQMTREILRQMREREVFACIDIHNNSGRNPHYAIVASHDPEHLSLAASFSDVVVHSIYPDSTNTCAFAPLCPSITIEAGIVGDKDGVIHVRKFLQDYVLNDRWHESENESVELYHTFGVVKVPQACSVGLHGGGADLELLPDIDRFNFQLMKPETCLGYVRDNDKKCLQVRSVDGVDEINDYLSVQDGRLIVRKPVTPAMLTADSDIIKMDCLCYLMHRL